MLVGTWAGAGGLGWPWGRPPTVGPTEGEEESADGEEEPTEGLEESTEGERGSTAAATLRGLLGRPFWRPSAGESADSEEEPTEGVEESTEGEGGFTAAAALQGRLGRPFWWPPAGELSEGEEGSTDVEEGPAATTPMEAIVQPGGERTVALGSGQHVPVSLPRLRRSRLPV